MMVYLSGKISGLTEKEYTENFRIAFNEVWVDCKVSYWDIISPLSIKPLFGIKKWLFYMITDLYNLRKCSHIALMKNWTDSKGCVVEYFFSKFIFKQTIIFL